MASPNADRSDVTKPTIDRRRLLQGLAATGTVTAAGYIDGDTVDSAEEGEAVESVSQDDGPTDPAEVQEGGRLIFAIERSGIGDFDQADSTLADDTLAFAPVYDGLFVQDSEGEMFLWMAEEYGVVDAQDVGPEDYTDHMEEYEITGVEDGVPFFDLDWPNLVLIRHPDDVAAVAGGELTEGDMMRVLTREEAPDAVGGGVYGTRVEGRLHEGMEFHNGTEVTAGDLVGSYDRFVGSATQGQVFPPVLHAEATNGDDGYEFALYSQEADAIAELALPPFQIYPEEHHDLQPGELEPREDGPVPVGTGPYEIADFDAGRSLLLERTDNYWLEEVGLENMEWWDGPEDFPEGPVIDEIEIRFVPEAGTRVASLQTGDIDVSYQLPAGDRTAFDEDPDFTVNAAPSTGFKFFQMPLEETEEGGAFSHREVRQAVSDLIPREAIVEIVDEGWGVPAEIPFPEPASSLGTAMGTAELRQQEWAYPIVPDVESAESLIEESPLEPPIPLILETNADDEERQDKVALIVDELNASGLFDARMETPADISDWVAFNLTEEESRVDYAQRNAAAIIGLSGGFDPHGYAEALHDPDNHNICCNFFFPEGTFDFMDLLRSCRFGVDVAEDADLRRERYDELWPEIATTLGNTHVDFGLETNVAGPDVREYGPFPGRDGFLFHSLYAPWNQRVAWLDRE